MGKEIERKFLVKGEDWKSEANATLCRQGYLSTSKHRTVRVRIMGEKGYLTVKGITIGASRSEYEYSIPFEEAHEMLTTLCAGTYIEKNQYRITLNELVWEVDEFLGDNHGLVVCEVELSIEDQPIDPPHWIGEEVTGDPRYYNSSLMDNPFKLWL